MANLKNRMLTIINDASDSLRLDDRNYRSLREWIHEAPEEDPLAWVFGKLEERIEELTSVLVALPSIEERKV